MGFDQNIRIGVLGGGQLGRMMIQSAIDFNLDISVLDGDSNAPCKNLVENFVKGKLTDFDAVYSFGKNCDLITIEIENVNTDALVKLQNEGKKVCPDPAIIKLIQNKVHQKQFYTDNNIPNSPYTIVNSLQELKSLGLDYPFVNKLATEGYDGRGVEVIRSQEELENGFDAPGLAEDYIQFEKEISVLVARNKSGEVKSFPPVELVFHQKANLIEYLFSPANISEEASDAAKNIALKIIELLEMEGLLAVEMFLTREGEFLVNEIAPRTHNSGHQTIEGTVTSQFEQHIRAILNLPLGSTDVIIPSGMVNLLGENGFTGTAIYQGIEEVMALEGTHIHLYGKKITKPFRKMGHVTITDNNLDRLKEKAKFVKSKMKIIA